jgi:carbon-monoxide dehydrogenase medium subunit
LSRKTQAAKISSQRRDVLKHFRQFLRAGSLEEAIAIRRDVGPKSLYIAGGTTVVPFGSKGVDVLIDITGLGLEGTSDHGDLISVGATTKLAELLHRDYRRDIPVIHKAASMVGSPLLRNMATLGGSLAGIFLPSDIGVALLATDAQIHLRGEEHRAVAIGDLLARGWLSGYELITEVRIAKRSPGMGAGFAKFGRSAVDISLVNAAAAVEVSGKTVRSLRIAVGQTGSKPFVLAGPALGAEGRDVTADLIRELAEKVTAAVKPKADSRASADYRKRLVGVMVARALADAVAEAGVPLAD